MVDVDGPFMLATVRVARGLTQGALASGAGMSQATVSKVEVGSMDLDVTRWERLAEVLDAPVELLRQPVGFAGAPAIVFHRKRASLPVSAAAQVRAKLDLLHLQVAGLAADKAPVRLTRRPLPADGQVSPEEVARQTRTELGLPAGPVVNLTATLEAAGVAVVRRPLGSSKIDALMSWPPDGRPVVLVGDHAPGDRQRFSMAHELGHAVMHRVPSEDQESEADRFASELLLPADELRAVLGDVSLPRLARLKEAWGASMAAILRRARDLGEISDYQYRESNVALSRAGYRTREPVEIPPEQPTLLDRLVAGHVGAGKPASDLARAAWMTEHDFRNTYIPEIAS